ncbi:MAG: hypothetical protein F6K55_13895 [Moorea sp. SIO4A3]|nr:hypothetical protein [Moorena sp. SIO4A3]
MANLITGQTHHYGLGEAVRSWGGSAVLGVSTGQTAVRTQVPHTEPKP